MFVEVPWQRMESVRCRVLGWQPGPVPGDADLAAVHLAELDASGEVCAAASYLPHPCPDRPDVAAIYLWGMAVLPSVQRLGSGRRLIAEVLARAAKIEVKIVWLDARQSAVGFYEKCGGVAVGDASVDDVTGLTDRRVVFDMSNRHSS